MTSKQSTLTFTHQKATELQPVRRGVYVRPALLEGLDAAAQHRLLIEATIGASTGVVSHVSAAVVHGLPVWNVSLARVHVTVDARQGDASCGGGTFMRRPSPPKM